MKPAFTSTFVTSSVSPHRHENTCAQSRPIRPPTASITSTNSDNNTGIIVVDHGSKRQAANDMIFKVAQDIQARTRSVPVFAAHMELAEPSIADAVEQCAQKGLNHVVVVPFFLSPGRHATEDIPHLTQQATNKYPNMTYDVKPPIGTHPSIIDVVLDRAGVARN